MSKKEIRNLVKQVLSKASDLSVQSDFLVTSLKKRKEWQMAKVVAMYLPLRDEPNIDKLILQGQRFCLKTQKAINMVVLWEILTRASKSPNYLSTLILSKVVIVTKLKARSEASRQKSRIRIF